MRRQRVGIRKRIDEMGISVCVVCKVVVSGGIKVRCVVVE